MLRGGRDGALSGMLIVSVATLVGSAVPVYLAFGQRETCMKRWRVAIAVGVGAVVLSGLGGFLFLRDSFSAPLNQLVLGRDSAEIPFLWHSADFGGRVEPYGAMLLPVAIPGTARQFHMQFDLGAPSSLFYRASLDTIQAHCDECWA